MEVLKIELKQHTPLLHFQHESVGATLRASEVKPGLDRYIRQMEDETIDEKLFDYKLSIRCSRGCNQKREKVKGFPFVLANLGESKTGIRMVDFIFHDTVELLFLFKYSKSKQYVEKYIDSFFAVTNFGNRKDKGFGSFFRTGESIDKRFFEKKLREGCKDSVIFYKKINDSLYKEFKSLESEYKRIKSGIRKEPKLLQYAQRKIKNLGSLWEKKAVKAFYRGMDIDDRYYYIRAYLGLADSMEYPQLNDTIVSIKSNSIERCPSPIYYKFWEGYVYVFLKIEGQESLGGETFMFTLKNENNKQKSSDENTFFIKVPKGLNLRDFFNEEFKNWEKL